VHSSGTFTWQQFIGFWDAILIKKSRSKELKRGWQLKELKWHTPSIIPWGHLAALQVPTGCKDDRDRLYSILGLIEDGKDFAVKYDESPADLFWRAGEHFQLWDNMNVLLLQQALRVSGYELLSSLSRKPDSRLTLRIRSASFKNPGPRKRIRCRHENGEVPCMPQHEILLCTRFHQYEGEDNCFVHLHVLLSRSPESACDIAFTLVLHDGKKFWFMELDDALLQVSGTSPPTAGEKSPIPKDERADRRRSECILEQDEWITMNRWGSLVELLATQTSDKLSERWRLSLLATNMLPQFDIPEAAIRELD
jgi:hypothetical protein